MHASREGVQVELHVPEAAAWAQVTGDRAQNTTGNSVQYVQMQPRQHDILKFRHTECVVAIAHAGWVASLTGRKANGTLKEGELLWGALA